MNCHSVQHSLWAHLDGLLPEDETQRVLGHLARCRACALACEQRAQVRVGLGNLPSLSVPEELEIRLRVLSSRERVRRVSRKTVGAMVEHFTGRARLWAENLMRPLALPFAGGLLSAVVLFGMLVPNIALHRQVPALNDVPTSLFSQATVKSSGPFGFADDDEFIVEVMVDGQGRMVDYWIAEGPSLTKDIKDIQVRRSIENRLVFTEFTPATAFFRPTYSRIFLSFSRSQINVTS
jgi:hypothetical protein